MKKQFAAMVLAVFLICQPCLLDSIVFSREISKAGQVFQDVKEGVVTVFSSSGHGSGSLVDADGLILTNNHVVKENKGHLRVKLSPGVIVQGRVLEIDRESDLAVLWINLDNVKHYKVLPLFKPDRPDNLVLVGEEVIAIGTPVQRETLAKTLTTGIVGKYEQSVIRHDASINGGNSGGPLLNYDGQIVGVNTFITSAKGPGIAGAGHSGCRCTTLLHYCTRNLGRSLHGVV